MTGNKHYGEKVLIMRLTPAERNAASARIRKMTPDEFLHRALHLRRLRALPDMGSASVSDAVVTSLVTGRLS